MQSSESNRSNFIIVGLAETSAFSYPLSAYSLLVVDFCLSSVYKKLFMRNYQLLDFWQKSHRLTLRIYKATQTFPKEEVYGITS